MRSYDNDSSGKNPLAKQSINGFCLGTVNVLNSYELLQGVILANRTKNKEKGFTTRKMIDTKEEGSGNFEGTGCFDTCVEDKEM